MWVSYFVSEVDYYRRIIIYYIKLKKSLKKTSNLSKPFHRLFIEIYISVNNWYSYYPFIIKSAEIAKLMFSNHSFPFIFKAINLTEMITAECMWR